MVERLHFLDEMQLLGFLHLNKTELSLMENPQTFVTQLRDYNLISEERYKKISRMKSKERIRNALYIALDWIEKERPKLIHRFWRCAFKETIVNKYPTLRLLRNSLYDGSYESESALLEGVGNEEGEDSNRKETSEEKKTGEEKDKKRKRATRRVSDEDEDEEQAGPSTRVTPRSRKRKKICSSSPLKKGEKGDIWTWDIFKVQLPVTCGDQKGTLNRDRLAKGEKCILVDKRWYTPSQFERLAGKASYKNWKLSIRCMDTPLGKLIEEGHLKSTGYRKGPKAKTSLLSFKNTITGLFHFESTLSKRLEKQNVDVGKKKEKNKMKHNDDDDDDTDDDDTDDDDDDDDDDDNENNADYNDEDNDDYDDYNDDTDEDNEDYEDQVYNYDTGDEDDDEDDYDYDDDDDDDDKDNDDYDTDEDDYDTDDYDDEDNNYDRKDYNDDDKDDDEEQPSSSYQMVLHSRKKKPRFTSLQPVICVNKRGSLNPDKLTKGKGCIQVNNLWYNLTEFVRLVRKESSRKLKESISFRGKTLGKLIQNTIKVQRLTYKTSRAS